ncbi:MAG: hypothetical protein P8Z00_13020 [Anaerolineales bacterium]|jgi:hypothetical protein
MTTTSATSFPETEIEIAPLADDLKLTFKAEFFEDELAAVPATSIVYSGETYYIRLTWNLVGKLAAHFCGVWLVKIDLESIGKAPEYSSECVKVDMDPCRRDDYSYTFRITPDTIQPNECGTVYNVAATLSSEDPCGKPGHIWAYGTGVSVMFVPGKPE